MGIFYNGKIDIYDFMWKPRLVADSIKSAFKAIGVKYDERRRFLPMKEYPEAFAYPRPQLVRDSYVSLNGSWEFSYCEEEELPESFPYEIKVPFPPQAKRSGLTKPVGDSFWYQKKFDLPEGFIRHKTVLHFGGVDQVARVFLNGSYLGKHEGGYLPFSFDVSELIKNTGNVLQVYVIDDLDPRYPYGKQVENPGGMWYSQISGIWQTVWLESLPEKSIAEIKCTWNEEKGSEEIIIKGSADKYELRLYSPAIYDGENANVQGSGAYTAYTLKNGSNSIPVALPKRWSPEKPYLYAFTLATVEDEISSYFALRTISSKRIKGHRRLCLNDKPYFFHGVLDQGYFSDGIWTPPSYRYYEKDIRIMKALGLNTLRKHLKIEPAQFYYDCDRIGMVVFQDMVNNGSYSYIRDTIMPTVFPFYLGHWKNDKNIKVKKHIQKFFVQHSIDTVRYLYNFPSVLYYTIFNEGWGQFDSERVLDIIRRQDKTRIYDSASGWYKQNGNSDVESVHCYFHKVPVEKWKKPVIISEFGGFSLRVKRHSCFKNQLFGYGSYYHPDDLTDRIVKMYEEEIIPHIRLGISGAIYTQLSDVEEEVNGFYTYDRKICKVKGDKMLRLKKKLNREIKKMQ